MLGGMGFEGSNKVQCDGDECERRLRVRDTARIVTLPPPWRVVNLPGWAGDFHVCSDLCEARLRKRYERPVRTSGGPV